MADLPALTEWKQGTLRASVVRNFVLANLVEPAVARLYGIGIGEVQFDVPTALGNVVSVPAPAAVQVDALKAIIDIGVPRTMGLVDGDGDKLPGVIALGKIEMEEVQANANAERMAFAAEVFAAEGDDPMVARIAAGEFEQVEVTEGIGAPNGRNEDEPPPPPSPELTPEQRILARRRARANGHNGNGHG